MAPTVESVITGCKVVATVGVFPTALKSKILTEDWAEFSALVMKKIGTFPGKCWFHKFRHGMKGAVMDTKDKIEGLVANEQDLALIQVHVGIRLTSEGECC